VADPLRVLFVEDSGDDAELEALQLRSAGFDVTYERVDTPEAMREALGRPWEVIIADYSMPAFSGLEALKVWRSLRPEIPFILVSGTLGEDRAVGALKEGAHDYLIKDNLRRLGPAVVRALAEAAARRQRAHAETLERFLAQASAVLGESLDYAQTLQRVAALAVPEVADYCAFEVEDVVTSEPAPRRTLASAGDEPADGDGAPAAGPAAVIELPLDAHGAVLGKVRLAATRAGRRFVPADQAMAEELARRVALAVDNAHLYVRAQEAVRLRDDFLSVASHELRTPLTTLLLQLQSLELALDRRGGVEAALDAPRDRDKIERAVRSTERLTTLVNGLVDVSRIASGQLDLAPEVVDLGRLARQVLDRHQPEAERASCELRLRADDTVIGRWDRGRLDQALTNLLSNALKYGPGKPVDVTVSTRDSHAELTVRDHGMGIAPHDLERIFGRYERAVSVRHYGGFGLGLYITRHIAEAHGGAVVAESTPGAGAAFTVRLPLQGAAAPA
jgi:signal transduction histidine kinase